MRAAGRDACRYAENDTALELVDQPRTKGEDYGFSLNLFDGKLVVRANRYDVATLNERNGQQKIIGDRVIRLEGLPTGAEIQPFNLLDRATDWVTALNPTWTSAQILAEVYRQTQITPEEVDLLSRGRTETADVRSKGEEIEIFFNPNSFWTTKVNVVRNNAFNTRLSPGLTARIARRMPLWTTIRDQRDNALWWTKNYGGTQTAEQSFLSGIDAPLRLGRATEGVRRPQIREWRANLSTSYRLAGFMEQKYLKRMRVGGAIRWEDKGAIGYYGIPVGGDITLATSFDPNRPIWSSGNTYVDAFVSYDARLFSDKVRARFQLNGRNLHESGGLRPVGAYPDGRPHTFRIINPRTFIFTATFDL